MSQHRGHSILAGNGCNSNTDDGVGYTTYNLYSKVRKMYLAGADLEIFEGGSIEHFDNYAYFCMVSVVHRLNKEILIV